MGYLDANNEIKDRLKSQWGTTSPIAMPNESYTPPNPQKSWIWLRIVEGDSMQMDIGTDKPIFRYAGTIVIQIFTKQDKGDSEALQYADKLKTIFNNWFGASVKCRAAYLKSVGTNGTGWYQLNVVVPFIRDEIL